MNIPSHYQNDLFNEIGQYFHHFEVVYAHAYDNTRKAQGWSFENSQNYSSQIIGKDLKMWNLPIYVFQNRKAVHIVNGIWSEKIFFFVILLLNILGVNFLIYSEAPNPFKKRSILTKISLHILVKPISKLLIYKAKGFLAVSNLAVNYFKNLGVPFKKIYRFGYFRNVEKLVSNNDKNTIIHFLFIGQLIERKGIFSLIEAIKNLSKTTQNFHLNIIGKGELEMPLKAFIEKNKIQKYITFCGTIEVQNVSKYISATDLLILPSIFDGWGIVVNEALQNGIPALVSNQCGANELINHRKNGLIFEAKNVTSLTTQLLYFMDLPDNKRAAMKKQAEKKAENISVYKAVQYLNLCLSHAIDSNNSKPFPLWLND